MGRRSRQPLTQYPSSAIDTAEPHKNQNPLFPGKSRKPVGDTDQYRKKCPPDFSFQERVSIAVQRPMIADGHIDIY